MSLAFWYFETNFSDYRIKINIIFMEGSIESIIRLIKSISVLLRK